MPWSVLAQLSVRLTGKNQRARSEPEAHKKFASHDRDADAEAAESIAPNRSTCIVFGTSESLSIVCHLVVLESAERSVEESPCYRRVR